MKMVAAILFAFSLGLAQAPFASAEDFRKWEKVFTAPILNLKSGLWKPIPVI